MTESADRLKVSQQSSEEFRGQMLQWYDVNRRTIPWRATPGHHCDPYHVWLSEIMCQQTTVAAVIPYFLKFKQRWPNVEALARAKIEDVMDAWAGLGYYARARNLHKCAAQVVHEYNGVFPSDVKSLKTLPGIGEYTSAAIAAIAFQVPAIVIDGNIERILSRFFDVQEPLPKSKPILKTLAAPIYLDEHISRPGDLAQALMDLGAMICTPKSPKCSECPLRDNCGAKARGRAASLPNKVKKKPKDKRSGYIYWIQNSNKAQVLLERRPDNVLLGGTAALPCSEWVSEALPASKPIHLDVLNNVEPLGGAFISHSFTHFDLTLYLYTARFTGDADQVQYYWQDVADLGGMRLPTVFQKALNVFLNDIS